MEIDAASPTMTITVGHMDVVAVTAVVVVNMEVVLVDMVVDMVVEKDTAKRDQDFGLKDEIMNGVSRPGEEDEGEWGDVACFYNYKSLTERFRSQRCYI